MKTLICYSNREQQKPNVLDLNQIPWEIEFNHNNWEAMQMYTVPKDNMHEFVFGRGMHQNGGASLGPITYTIKAFSAGIHMQYK